MRGGTSKGVFFLERDLPEDWAEREALLLRILGSPDPYGTQIDGMGGASSSTSKVAIIGESFRDDCDVDYLFGAVAIDRPLIDWSGNCGNLTAAVGPFAIAKGLVRAPREGVAVVRIWQANLGAKIIARVPVREGAPLEAGDFILDGVAFPSAEIGLEFIDPADASGGAFPTGKPLDRLEVPGLGRLELSLVSAGNPAVFIDAAALGLSGTELPAELNADSKLLTRFEVIRSHAAVAMGLAATPEEATRDRPATPKIAIVGPPATYRSTAGKTIEAASIDLVARIVSMGRVHHAMTGTGSIALAVAAAVPGTTVSRAARRGSATQGASVEPVAIGEDGLAASEPSLLRIGHAAGSMAVGAEVGQSGGEWTVRKVTMSRSARILMSGFVHAPR